MKTISIARVLRLAAGMAGLLFIAYVVLLLFLSPSGEWQSCVVREHPLAAPIAVSAVQGKTLVTVQGEISLVGVEIPGDAESRANADSFLKAVTAKGIEVIRTIPGTNTAFVRGEVRLYHSCGNDPVAAHFEQHNLNEIMVGLGYARFDRSEKDLTEEERLRLAAAETVAKKTGSSVWGGTVPESNETLARFGFRLTSGLRLMDVRIRNESRNLQTEVRGQ